MVGFSISYSPEMTEYHRLGLVHFFVDICSENNQVHFRCPSSNILVMTNFDSSWSVLDFEWKPWDFFSFFILGSVVADDSCSLYTGVGGKESVLLVPQITLKSSCFQSLFHDMKHGIADAVCSYVICHCWQSELPSTSSFLARKLFLSEGVFSPIICYSGRCFNIHMSGCYMSSQSEVTWASEGFYYSKRT